MSLCKGGRLRTIGDEKGNLLGYGFWCPGCDGMHVVCTERTDRPRWGFNGDVERPTFTPSLLCYEHPGQPRCHSFIRDGQIQFLGDCTHALKGQTVEIPSWPEDHSNFHDGHGEQP